MLPLICIRFHEQALVQLENNRLGVVTTPRKFLENLFTFPSNKSTMNSQGKKYQELKQVN